MLIRCCNHPTHVVVCWLDQLLHMAFRVGSDDLPGPFKRVCEKHHQHLEKDAEVWNAAYDAEEETG